MNTHAGNIDLKQEVHGIRIAAVKATGFCLGCIVAGYYILPRFFTFPTTLVEALIFTIRVDLFVLLWVVAGIGLVSHARRQSLADIGGAAFGTPTPKIRIKIAFLQNTLEQTAVAIGSHIVLSTLISGAALSLIVVATVLFGIGRISFYRGYPHGAASRAFGLVTTALPGLIAFGLSIVLIALKVME